MWKGVLFAISHLENFEILNHVDDVYSKYVKRIISYFKYVYIINYLTTLSNQMKIISPSLQMRKPGASEREKEPATVEAGLNKKPRPSDC